MPGSRRDRSSNEHPHRYGPRRRGYGPFGEINDQFRRTEVSALPFDVQNAREASIALWRLVANGTIAEDYARIKRITVFTLAPSTLHSKVR